jgi:hypothetical protein
MTLPSAVRRGRKRRGQALALHYNALALHYSALELHFSTLPQLAGVFQLP